MRIRTPREQRILYFKTILRWTLYYLVIFLCFLIMTSGTWTKPILLVPCAVAIAVGNGQYSSAVSGAFCGFLIDIACGKLVGYNAALLAVFCIIISLLYELYLRNKFVNYIVITAVLAYIQCWLDYKFYYEMWEYDNVERIFSQLSMKVWALTIISACLIYIIIEFINKKLMPKNHVTIEEAINTAIRSEK
ncbi:MAG: rod shape-determining protein MreD [Ruminococcus sp.]|nr:rod shape-determining protein MreD [Ruminococcus sp.]